MYSCLSENTLWYYINTKGVRTTTIGKIIKASGPIEAHIKFLAQEITLFQLSRSRKVSTDIILYV